MQSTRWLAQIFVLVNQMEKIPLRGPEAVSREEDRLQAVEDWGHFVVTYGNCERVYVAAIKDYDNALDFCFFDSAAALDEHLRKMIYGPERLLGAFFVRFAGNEFTAPIIHQLAVQVKTDNSGVVQP